MSTIPLHDLLHRCQTRAPSPLREAPQITSFVQAKEMSFPFLKLPAEIRVMVYNFVLVKPNGIRNIRRWRVHSNTALLRVCRLIRREAWAIYPSKNMFQLDIRSHPLSMSRTSASFLSCLREVTFTVTVIHDLFEVGKDVNRSQATWPSLIHGCPELQIVHIDLGNYRTALPLALLQLGYRKNFDASTNQPSGPKITATVNIGRIGDENDRARGRTAVWLSYQLSHPFRSMAFGNLTEIRLHGTMAAKEVVLLLQLAYRQNWMEEKGVGYHFRLDKQNLWRDSKNRDGRVELAWTEKSDTTGPRTK